MSENQATKSDLAKAIAIHGKDESIVWKALKRLAENECFSGLADERLWAKPRNSSDIRTQTSRQTLKYFLALLIVGLFAILLGENGA